MKKLFILCVSVLMTSLSLWAQDIIITNDAQKIEAKILEVSKNEIKYKEKGNLNGPTFVLETSEISSIIYSNGQVKVYNQPAKSNTSDEQEIVNTNKEQPISTMPVVDESTAQILLLSGESITVQITEMKTNYVAYIHDGKPNTMPASLIEKITFLQNGQVKVYNNNSSNIVSKNTSSQKEVSEEMPSGRIYRDNGRYLYNGTYISDKEVELILQRENNEAYRQWQKAGGMLIGGAVCTGIGGGLVVGGLVSLITGNTIACIGMECAALVPLGIGLGLTFGSSARYNKAIDIYNSKYDQAAVQLKWHVAPNEVGLAIAF